MSDPFDNKTNVIPENSLETLVGEGLKFADNEALAKSKLEADAFIEQLKREASERSEAMANLEKEVIKGQGAREIYDLLSKEQSATEATQTTEAIPAKTSEVDIDELLNQKLAERDAKSTLQRNVEESASALRSQFGDNTGEVIKRKAGELGMSEDSLKEMAGTNPKVFLALLGQQEQARSIPAAVSPSTVMVNGVSSVRNNEYYSKLAKTSPAEYHKPSTRAQMLKDAVEQGENFY